MRVKQIWNYVPVPAKLKLLVDRITFSRITIFYVAFSVLHCIIQVVFQAQAFTINADAARFLQDIIAQGNASATGFAVLGPDLRVCQTVPKTLDVSACPVVWNGKSMNTSTGLMNPGITDEVYSQGVSSASSLVVLSSTSLTSLDPIPTLTTTVEVIATSSATPVSQSSISLSSSSSTSTVSTTTVIVAARPTIPIALLDPDDVEIPTISGHSTVSTTQTLTVTVKVSPSQTPAAADNTSVKQKRDDNPHVISALTTNGSTQVKVGGLDGVNEVTLSNSCLVALNWPVASVDNTKREDVAFIGFSIWVLGMSLVAVLNESPPHIVASFLTHMLATGWAAFQLVSTRQFHSDFSRLTTKGACGINLLPDYWTKRAQAEIPTLALNALALLVSAFLSWKLMKSFGWQTFKRIGASLTMSRAYRSVLVFSIAVQLSIFFIVVAVALWLDQLFHGEIASMTTSPTIFKAITIVVLILMVPWLTLGWISVRREYKIPMFVFLVLSFGYTMGWAAMFAAPTFRWTFMEWRFFSVMAAASVFLAIITFVLGVMCYMNFGKGLSRYLNAQEPLPGDDFEPATYDGKYDEEKVNFPAYETPVPTFSAAYGANPQVPPPAYAFAPRTLGPRFFNNDASPFESQPSGLSRQGSGSSQNSSVSSKSSSSDMSMKGKRWIIE